MEAPLEETCVRAEPGCAICVQRFDDSLNSAIRTTYRISLRSSSLREPRYRSARVVCVSTRGEAGGGRGAPEAIARSPRAPSGEGEHAPARILAGRAREARRRAAATEGGDARAPGAPETPQSPGGEGGPGTAREEARWARRRQRETRTVRKRWGWKDPASDPSAGSPTETLLRLLLPLNDKVWAASHGIAAGEPAALPQSKDLTGSFNR